MSRIFLFLFCLSTCFCVDISLVRKVLITMGLQEADNIKTCMTETKFDKLRDFMRVQSFQDIPDNAPMLCFSKCFFEKLGFLDANGKIVIKTIENSDLMGKLDGAGKEKMLACLSGVGPIKTCNDIKTQLTKCQ